MKASDLNSFRQRRRSLWVRGGEGGNKQLALFVPRNGGGSTIWGGKGAALEILPAVI